MLLIKNARILDPGFTALQTADIFIKDGEIAPLDAASNDTNALRVLNADGLVAAPGLVDMHVHFRDPGFTYKEDVFSGARAAAAGGVTTVACMPNTAPVIDSAPLTASFLKRAAKACVTVLTYGAVTTGQKGVELTDTSALKASGVIGLSDDGQPVVSAAIMRAALKASKVNGLFISSHCEDLDLVGHYALNEGRVSEQLGLPGRPAIAEELMAMREAMLARETGARVHIAHVSTARTVDIIRRAKADGVLITAETCPQYFTLTEDEIIKQGSMAKVNPPLRTQNDVDAVIEGLIDGTLDAIVTDHAPHSIDEKALPLTQAPSGMVGLETSFGLALTALYHTGKLPLERIISLMSCNPAAILGIPKGHIRIGDAGDIVLFDPDEDWTVDPGQFQSKGRNTPFTGRRLRGKVKCTIRSGEIVYRGE